MAINVGLLGGSGYAGAELLRLLEGHPAFELHAAAANVSSGLSLAAVHPNLSGYADVVLCQPADIDYRELDLLFVALPHGASGSLTSSLPEELAVVDLGADHRLLDASAWSRYYGTADFSQPWTYGLAELPGRRELIARSRRIANPGCYATAIQLACAPLLATGRAEAADIVAVAASGTSGAGRKAAVNLSASEVMGSVSAYKVGGAHQHIAEITQELGAIAGGKVTLSMTPLLAPMPRGILATTTLKPTELVSTADLRALFADFYQASAFVNLASDDSWPGTAATTGTNNAIIQCAYDAVASRIVVVCCIDNLGKGAAGQAIQNANLMFGLAETTGLPRNAIAP